MAAVCQGQYIEIRCVFGGEIGYGCGSSEFVVRQSETQTTTFVGVHLPGRSNFDVTGIGLLHPTLPFFVSEIFNTFPNLQRLHLAGGTHLRIQSGSFKNASNLQSLEISGVTDVELSDFALTGAGNVTVLQIADCEALRIDEHAFDGLNALEQLLIFRSNIHRLGENTFTSLVNLNRFQLHQGHIGTISAKLFAANNLLRNILFVMVPINEIERGFIDKLEQLEVLGLEGASCVSNLWSNVRENWEQIHRDLEPCYRRFDDMPRQFSMELRGSLIVRAQRGDLVVVL